MNYANKLGVPFVIFLGEDEINAQKVTVKNMLSGQQETLDRELAGRTILTGITELAAGTVIKEP